MRPGFTVALGPPRGPTVFNRDAKRRLVRISASVAAALWLGVLLAGCFQTGPNATEATDPVVLQPQLLRYVANSTGIGFDSFEPSIGVLNDGALFVGTWLIESVAGPVSRASPGVARSVDGGATWQDVTPQVAGQRFPPASNDPYLHVDPDWGRVFMFDLQGASCHTLSWSDDAGTSWTSNPAACGQPAAGQDHPTLFTSAARTLLPVGVPKLVHYCINQANLHVACATSLDGGRTWGPLVPGPFADDPAGPAPGSHALCNGRTGHGVADGDGRLYLARGHCGIPRIAVSEDDGQTWSSYPIDTGASLMPVDGLAPVPGAPQPSHHEVSLAVDEGGVVHAVWTDALDLPWLAASTDQGRSWSMPVLVASENITATAFATVAAGGPGKVAIAYYGTTSATDRNAMTESDTWNGYLVVVEDAVRTPRVFETQVNPFDDPLVRGACAGTRCTDKMGRSEVGDFIDIVVDNLGRPWASFVDVCLEACAETEAYAPGGQGLVATLASGPSLRGNGTLLPALVPA